MTLNPEAFAKALAAGIAAYEAASGETPDCEQGWIPWAGGERPVFSWYKVDVRLTNGDTIYDEVAGELIWAAIDDDLCPGMEIVSYRRVVTT